MENIKIKKSNKGVGRPKYQPNIEQLQELYKKVRNKEITNEIRLADWHGIHKTLWFELKKKYETLEVK